MYQNRVYTAVFERVAVTAAQDLFELVASANAELRLKRLQISQDSDQGAAAAQEMLDVLIHSGTTSGSGGSTVVPNPQNQSAAFGGTCEANNTTQSTEGVIKWAHSFDIWNGLDIQWEKGEYIYIPRSGRINIELQAAPQDELTMSGTLTFEEEYLV